jgi:hypothetical protein
MSFILALCSAANLSAFAARELESSSIVDVSIVKEVKSPLELVLIVFFFLS